MTPEMQQSKERAQYATLEDERTLTAEEMDEERRKRQAYEYLCHLQEAREWIEEVIGEKTSEEPLEEALRDGVYLAQIVLSFSQNPRLKIFRDETLQYRHTDNINIFFDFAKQVGLPEIFVFELVDLYEKKNVPKVIYCIHALGHYLSKLKMTSNLKNLVGKAQFTDAEITQKQREIKEAGLQMPSFSNISVTFERTGKPSERGAAGDSKPPHEGHGLVDAREQQLPEDYGSVEQHPEAISMIQSKMRTFLATSALSQIYGDEELTIFALRMYLPLFVGNEEEEELRIEELNLKLSEMLRANGQQEKQLENLENRIFLLIKNKIRVKGKIQDGLSGSITQFQYKSLQKLFSLLHNEPEHLCKMLMHMRRSEADEFVGGNKLLSLFGNIAGQREEYCFLKFVEHLLKKEVDVSLKRDEDFVAGRVLRRFLVSQGLLDSIISLSLILRKALDGVECDPSYLYAKTYACSPVPRDVALADDRVRELYTEHLVEAGAAMEKAAMGIKARASTMPYPLRFFAKALLLALNTRFPGKEAENMRGVASYLWEMFFIPIFVAPDIFIKNAFKISDAERRACIYVCGVIARICKGEGPKDPLCAATGSVWALLREAFIEIMDTEGISEHFRPQFLDERAYTNNFVCLSGADMNDLARMLCSSGSSSIRAILKECGQLPPSEKIFFLLGGDDVDVHAPASSSLTRATKWAVARLLMHVSGKNLADLLQKRSTLEEELGFEGDLEAFKDEIRANLEKLGEMGIANRDTFYGEVLTFIAGDILHRRTRADQRTREIIACERAILSLEKSKRDLEMRRQACAQYLAMVYEKVMGAKRPVKRSAVKLMKEGVLVNVHDCIPSQIPNIDFVFSGEPSGLIAVDLYILGMKSASDTVKLDDLLLKESLGSVQLVLPEVGCMLNIRETIDFINKKFLL